jgi:hypothetical protein
MENNLRTYEQLQIDLIVEEIKKEEEERKNAPSVFQMLEELNNKLIKPLPPQKEELLPFCSWAEEKYYSNLLNEVREIAPLWLWNAEEKVKENTRWGVEGEEELSIYRAQRLRGAAIPLPEKNKEIQNYEIWLQGEFIEGRDEYPWEEHPIKIEILEPLLPKDIYFSLHWVPALPYRAGKRKINGEAGFFWVSLYTCMKVFSRNFLSNVIPDEEFKALSLGNKLRTSFICVHVASFLSESTPTKIRLFIFYLKKEIPFRRGILFYLFLGKGNELALDADFIREKHLEKEEKELKRLCLQ